MRVALYNCLRICVFGLLWVFAFDLFCFGVISF